MLGFIIPLMVMSVLSENKEKLNLSDEQIAEILSLMTKECTKMESKASMMDKETSKDED